MAHLGTTAVAAGLKMELCHPKEHSAVRTKHRPVYQKRTNNPQNQTSPPAPYLRENISDFHIYNTRVVETYETCIKT